MKIDVVCVYNKKELYDQMTKSALEMKGSHELRFIGLDNTGRHFPSAAAAYNFALAELCGADVCFFVHQDIIFGEGTIERLGGLCLGDENTIFGAAGADFSGTNPKNAIVSSIREGNSKEYDTLKSGELKEVFCLDECLIAANKKVFDRISFDEKVLNNWHFYAVDLCLTAHKEGIGVKAVGLKLSHLSGGSRDAVYRAAEKKIAAKWRKDYKILVFTTGWTYTDRLRFLLLRIFRFVKGTL